MRRLYTFLLYLMIPYIVLRLYWKGRKMPAYRQRILERFSIGKKELTPVDVWVHAVSLGEIVAATPLIDALLAKQWRVLVTTMTPTGSEYIIKRFGNRVVHQYLPYDFPWALRRFFKTYTPRLGINMETELWPNVIYQSAQMKIPRLLINARISDEAFKQYRIVRFMFKPLLNKFTAIFAQSDLDAKRYIALGAASNLVQVVGNIKFDIQVQRSENKECMALKEAWGAARPVLIAASTHDEEEKQLLSRFNLLKEAIPDIILLLVPRHPERFQAVYQLSKAAGFNTGLRSQSATINTNTDVIVVDTMGELLNFYQVSDYAFVGGSLVPVGGHNVLEPMAVQVPVFCGPYMNNSKSICRDLCAAKAIVMVENADELLSAIIALHFDKAKRVQQMSNASNVLRANRGAVVRYMEKIDAMLRAC